MRYVIIDQTTQQPKYSDYWVRQEIASFSRREDAIAVCPNKAYVIDRLTGQTLIRRQ